MVGMLMAGDGGHLPRSVILHRGLARQIGDADHPAEPGFGSKLAGRHHPVRPVESAGQHLDPRPADAAEGQRRAAGRAEIALGYGRRLERRRLAAGPGKVLVLDIGKGGERCAGRLLAHPAVTDADP